MAAVLLGVAEMEQETRRERQSAGIASAKERGVYSSRKPRATKGSPRRAVELRKRGMTDNEIATTMKVE